jgi:uncharacterized protein YdaL
MIEPRRSLVLTTHRRRTTRGVLTLVVAGAAAVSLLATPSLTDTASAKGDKGRHHPRERASSNNRGLRPADLKAASKDQLSKDASRRKKPRQRGAAVVAAAAATPGAVTAAAAPTTLVLYDTAGQWGYLGELYATMVANLAGHFGTVTAAPVSAYKAGQLNGYTATVYVGSTYDGGLPAAFSADVLAGTRPVVWLNDNIWTMANQVGVQQFITRYGWDPTNSYFGVGGSPGAVTSVAYRSQTLPRTFPAGTDGGVLRPALVPAGNPAVSVLATAKDTSTNPATTFPWAVRSGNLTYVGEIPFSYVAENDRVIAFEDLLFDALAPGTPTRHRALVRLEDISPASDPAQLRAMADYLYSQKVPFGVNVIPVYTDPLGEYNGGVKETITLTQAPTVLAAIKYMLTRGGVLLDHGYTHQYAAVKSPYTGVSGDDFEFFRAHVDAADNVVLDGPVAEDSTAWANGRITAAKNQFKLAGLPTPTIWVTPHYTASDTDSRAIAKAYTARWERVLYPSGALRGVSPACPKAKWPCTMIGQFMPYPVKDVFGGLVLPETLGNYEPEAYNNHPARLPADLVASARSNLAVRDGFASFFYHPTYPLAPLQQIVTGIKGLGYTFVSPAAVTLN